MNKYQENQEVTSKKTVQILEIGRHRVWVRYSDGTEWEEDLFDIPSELLQEQNE